jgi:hypothetical protein
MSGDAEPLAPDLDDPDALDLQRLGYMQRLHRAMGTYTSFALGCSLVSITTGIFTAFSAGLVNISPCAATKAS